MSPEKEKVNVYIDGFNLYFGMTSKFKKWAGIDGFFQDVNYSTSSFTASRSSSEKIGKPSCLFNNFI
jgi:hypothetical protein